MRPPEPTVTRRALPRGLEPALMGSQPVIYFDVSDVVEFVRSNTRLSGIQRVSLEIVKYLSEHRGDHDLRLICYHPTLKRMVWFSAKPFSRNYSFDHSGFCRYFGIVPRREGTIRIKEYLKKRYRSSAKRLFHGVRLRLRNMLDGGHTFARHKLVTRRSRRLKPKNAFDVCFAKGDRVFISGATWGGLFQPYMDALEDAKRRLGIEVSLLVHDLIPLIAPEHVVNDVPEQFSDWLGRMCRFVDLFLVNSESTGRDLDRFMRAHAAQVVPVRVVPLAHEFLLPDDPGGSRRQASARFLDPQRHSFGERRIRCEVLNAALLPYVLVVGTIESRKNVWTIAIVWQEIYRRLGLDTPRLVFAGKQGWAKQAFDDFLLGTGHLDGYIRIVDRPDDAELAYLYRRCLFSVSASYYEGWGLPIGEGLWFGRPVVASNVSAMPEVGGSLVEYVDPYDPKSIRDACLKLITDDAYREAMARRIRREDLRRWSDVAEGIWQALTAPAGTKPEVKAVPARATDALALAG
ncbi:glycosyltransferase family 4 protein [Inquilinus sp. CA228]|uniref:glycosyltransferase family 4 protein n=1 Tax=Inquilinus sp. CA228 TaxID=3455609 RepID=UPI003F8D26A8